MAEWSQLISGEVSEEEAQDLLKKGATDLDAFFKAHPQADKSIQDILDRQLRDGIDARTWQTLGTSLITYLGNDRSQLVEWVFAGDGSELEKVAKYASPQVMDFLRRIMGVYGPDLRRAYYISDQLPNDWSYIYRNVYFDAITERFLLRLRVEKYNGEEFLIEGAPNAFIHMTELLIRSLIALGTPEVFSETNIAQFQDAANTFLKLLAPDEEDGTSIGGSNSRPSEEAS